MWTGHNDVSRQRWTGRGDWRACRRLTEKAAGGTARSQLRATDRTRNISSNINAVH